MTCTCPCINCSNSAHWMCSTCSLSREEMVDLGDGISVCVTEPLTEEEEAAVGVELMLLMRHRRRLGRSGWRKPGGRAGKPGVYEQTFEPECGTMMGIKSGPNPDASTSESGPNRRPDERTRG